MFQVCKEMVVKWILKRKVFLSQCITYTEQYFLFVNRWGKWTFSQEPQQHWGFLRRCSYWDEQASHLCLLHLIFPQTAQLWPSGNSSCWYDYRAKEISYPELSDMLPLLQMHSAAPHLPSALVWWRQRCLEAETRDPESSRRWPLQPGRTKTPL